MSTVQKILKGSGLEEKYSEFFILGSPPSQAEEEASEMVRVSWTLCEREQVEVGFIKGQFSAPQLRPHRRRVRDLLETVIRDTVSHQPVPCSLSELVFFLLCLKRLVWLIWISTVWFLLVQKSRPMPSTGSAPLLLCLYLYPCVDSLIAPSIVLIRSLFLFFIFFKFPLEKRYLSVKYFIQLVYLHFLNLLFQLIAVLTMNSSGSERLLTQSHQ